MIHRRNAEFLPLYGSPGNYRFEDAMIETPLTTLLRHTKFYGNTIAQQRNAWINSLHHPTKAMRDMRCCNEYNRYPFGCCPNMTDMVEYTLPEWRVARIVNMMNQRGPMDWSAV